MSAKRLLVIAYQFPPRGGPGVQRVLSFVRHLPKFGWYPHVISAPDDGRYWAKDPSLMAKISADVGVDRVSEGLLGEVSYWVRRVGIKLTSKKFEKAFYIPDNAAPWLLPAAYQAVVAGRRLKVDAVFASGPPWTGLLVGQVASHVLGVPLIVDFRDPWTLNSMFKPISPLHRVIHRELEQGIYRSAQKIIANTDGNLADLLRAYPWSASKSLVIPNGWDDEDFTDLPLQPQSRQELVIGYVGNFYGEHQGQRALELISQARYHSETLKKVLRLHFVGNTQVEHLLKKYDLQDISKVTPYVPLQQALHHLAHCHVSLVTLPVDAKHGWVPQKLYQSMRLGRPILTIAPKGDAIDLTNKTRTGLALVSDSVGAVTKMKLWLEDVYSGQWQYQVDNQAVARFNRVKLTEQLVEQLESVSRRV